MSAEHARDRIRWMDVLRGSAILLVVLSHSTRVLGEVVPEVPAVTALDDFFAPYRMPMLMFLSGMLLPVALAKPLGTYYLGKARRLLWPYVVWVVVLALVGAAPGPLTDPGTWYATSYLWYLFFLLCYFAVAPLVRRLPPAAVAAGAVGLVLVSVPLDAASDGRIKLLLYLGAFFALGHVAASLPRLLDRVTAPGRPVAAGVVLAGLAPGIVALTTGAPPLEGLFAVLSVLGVLATIVLAKVALHAGGTRFVEWVGRNSIVFYVVHFPFLVLIARAIEGWGVAWDAVTGSLVVAAAFALSLALGSALTALRHVRPVGWLFELPAHGSPASSPGAAVPAQRLRG